MGNLWEGSHPASLVLVLAYGVSRESIDTPRESNQIRPNEGTERGPGGLPMVATVSRW